MTFEARVAQEEAEARRMHEIAAHLASHQGPAPAPSQHHHVQQQVGGRQ